MQKIALPVALIFLSASALAAAPCHTVSPPPSHQASCQRSAFPDEKTQIAQTGHADLRTGYGKPLTQEDLKREVKEEHARQEAAQKSLARKKRCAILEKKMTAAHDEMKATSGKRLEEAEKKYHRATENYVTECPK